MREPKQRCFMRKVVACVQLYYKTPESTWVNTVCIKSTAYMASHLWAWNLPYTCVLTSFGETLVKAEGAKGKVGRKGKGGKGEGGKNASWEIFPLEKDMECFLERTGQEFLWNPIDTQRQHPVHMTHCGISFCLKRTEVIHNAKP